MRDDSGSEIGGLRFLAQPLLMAVISGAITLLILGYISSYITPDDYHAKQSLSLFGDGRFVTGFIYEAFKGAFGNDAGFRLLMCFAVGFTGYLFFNRFAEVNGFDQTSAALFGVISVASLGSAYAVFIYDMNMLFYSIAFPVLYLWTIVLDRSLNRRGGVGIAPLFASLLIINFVLISVFQIYAYFIFILLAAILLTSESAQWKALLRFCIISVAACVLAVVISMIFTNSDLYKDITGYTLRGRTNPSPSGDGLIGMVKDFVATSFDFSVFQRNSLGPHVVLLAFIAFKSVSRDLHLSLWRYVMLILLVVTIYFSPFMLSAQMAENPRVLQSLYVFGLFAYFFAAMKLAMETKHKSVLSNFQAVTGAAAIALLVALVLYGRSYHRTVSANEIFVALIISALFLVTAVRHMGRDGVGILICVGVAFFGVEIQKSVKATDRWNSERVFDRIIVDKITESVMDNFYKYGSTSWNVEYGMQKKRLAGTAVQSYSYSMEEFWKNSMQSLGTRIKFKRDDDLCTGLEGSMFHLIESAPGEIKFCL